VIVPVALPSRSHIRSVRVSTFLLAASMLALPDRLSGQRMSCAQADSVLRSDVPGHEKGFEAVGRTLKCPETRVATFMALVRHAPPNSVADTLAGWATWSLFDPRMVDSVAVLSKELEQPRHRRLYHLALLTRYADCGIALNMIAFDRDKGSVTSGSLHGCGMDGWFHALPLADRDRARAAIAWISQHDPDDRLRGFAAYVEEELAVLWASGLQTPSRTH
jgi:hypothetical protein